MWSSDIEVELEVAVGAGPGNGGVVSEDPGCHHRDGLTHEGIEFAGHDGGAGLSGGEGDFADRTAWTGAEEAEIVGDLEKADCDGVELAMAFDEGVLGGLCFEVVPGLAKRDSGFLRDEGDGLGREVGMADQAAAL